MAPIVYETIWRFSDIVSAEHHIYNFVVGHCFIGPANRRGSVKTIYWIELCVRRNVFYVRRRNHEFPNIQKVTPGQLSIY